VEGGLRRLLEGGGVEKLQALRELATRDVLGDPKLEGHAADRIVELTGEEETAKAASALFDKGRGQYRNKEYDAALVSYGKALEIYTKLEGEEGTNAIRTRQDIANVYAGKGEHERALEEYEVALKLSKASSHPKYGEEGEWTARIIGNMGNVYKKMKNYDKALELLKRSLEMDEKAGSEKAGILSTVGHIAQTYDDMGRYSEAVEWHERGLAGQEAELGKNHSETLISVYNLALACKNAGDLDRAVELFERCLAGDEEGGDESGARGTALNLGKVLRAGGARFAAKLAALEQKYPNVMLNGVNNLAIACSTAGDLDQAVELFERCLAGQEEGGDESDARGAAMNLGKALKKGGPRFAAKLAALKQKYPSMVTRM
jgi:tetratricopeptide (TPR) repeat protein